MTEQWRPVVGYEGLYEVSDLGRVSTTRRKGSPGGLRKIQTDHLGYQRIGLCRMGQQSSRLVHALVIEAFIGPRPAGLEVRHLDGDPTNAALSNLAYGTSSENKLDTVRHGTHFTKSRTHCPQDHPYDEVNTRWYQGRRYCRTCHRERRRVTGPSARPAMWGKPRSSQPK